MKNLIVATMAAIFLAGCAVHAGIGSHHHGVEVNAGIHVYDKDKAEHRK
jgi:hypothetical protein